MVQEDEERFYAVLTGIADYYSRELSVTALRLYWVGLKKYDLQAVEKAMWAHTQNPDSGQFMPKIADIAKMMEGRTEDQAQLAWSKVDSAVRSVGSYEDVAFDDALIHRVIADMGGWVLLCMKEDKEFPFVAKEFVTRYRGYRMNGQTPEYPRWLIGAASSHNASEGINGKLAVRLLGNATIARNVIKGGAQQIEASGLKRVTGGEP